MFINDNQPGGWFLNKKRGGNIGIFCLWVSPVKRKKNALPVHKGLLGVPSRYQYIFIYESKEHYTLQKSFSLVSMLAIYFMQLWKRKWVLRIKCSLMSGWLNFLTLALHIGFFSPLLLQGIIQAFEAFKIRITEQSLLHAYSVFDRATFSASWSGLHRKSWNGNWTVLSLFNVLAGNSITICAG